MFHIALWEPEIPPNTGNIARLCAATEAHLHLIGRLGFRIDDRSVRRAGLDYWDDVTIQHHDDLAGFEIAMQGVRVHCLSARRGRIYTSATFADGDCLLFGNETHGLPSEVLDRHGDNVLTIPMPSGKIRSLNLATSVGIVLYEAIRQVAH